MRTVTIKEFVLEELNRMLAEEGRDVRIVEERPRPKLVGEVIELKAKGEEHGDE